MGSQQQSAENLFLAALEHEPAERPAFLDHACANAPGLRALVEELLLEDERAGSYLKRPLFDAVDSARTAEILPISNSSRRPATAVAPRFQPGELIAGRFTVARFIARGGMGEVYEVEDRFLQGAHVALKMILPEIAADAEASHRFEQEVLLARKVNHPNLCPIYDIFRNQDPPPPFLFLTMKLLSGETLGARLRDPIPIPSEEAIAIFRQLVSGIAAIHAAGVIHRDIKPNNVMLDHSGPTLCVSVMDFGLARLHESEATVLRPGTVAGTPGYLAPELLAGHSPSQATDLFALGVLLHQVLTGKRPIDTNGPDTVTPSPSLATASVPHIYLQTVRELLSTEPNRRCRAFDHIHATLDSHSSLHSPTHPAPRLWSRRNFAIASATTAVAAIGGVAWKHDGLYDALHPLPAKRFVALLGWPPTNDSRLKPMLMGLIDAMANELARAEAFDHDLFVIAQRTATDMTSLDQLNETRESLGANLVLATSAIPAAHNLQVSFQVLDPNSPHPLRTRTLQVPVDQQLSLPEKAVRTAANLLDITHYQPDEKRTRAGTQNSEALAAFREAEALMKQPNNTGLEAAIEKYKQAVDADGHFVLAYARLAGAYALLYELRRDPSSMILGRANADTALSLDPHSTEAHVALGSVLWESDALPDALHEMTTALSLDPSDTRTMTYQAQIYTAQNRWAEAEAAYKRVIRLRPNHWLAYDELGNNYNAQADYVSALAAYRAASAVAPTRALPLNNVASMLFQLGSFDQALTEIDKCIALQPGLDGAHQTRADILRAQGKYKDALKASLQAAKLNPDEGTNWLEVGDAYTLLPHRGKEAAEAYLRALEAQEKQLKTQPGNGPGWMLLALYRVKTGDPTSALALIKKAEALGAADVYSQLFKIRTLELLGRRDEALATVTTAMHKGVTVAQIAATHDLDSLRGDLRFPVSNHSHVVLPQEPKRKEYMKGSFVPLIALAFGLLNLTGCDDPHKEGKLLPPPPATLEVKLSPDATVSHVKAGDTLVFTWDQAGGQPYYVHFVIRSPCKGGSDPATVGSDPRVQCHTKSHLDDDKLYPFKYGHGTWQPSPGGFSTDSAIVCRPYCR